MGELRAVEQHFLRYQCSGDPAALAAVFDALAPRLLLLAAHLTRDRQAAEDLVQETFVAAMRSAKEFRAGAALMPWLSGILSRRARALLRARRRTLDVERLARPEAADPCTAAADAELVARLAQAIEELAPPYREALLLRLHHGLDSRAIGHVLGRAPDTVRSQLRRGLARLRHRLPPSLLAPAMALLTPPSGLAAMRTAVLRAAAKPAAAPAAAIGAVLAGGLVIKKLLWVAACAAAVLLWRPWEGEAPPAGASAVRVEMPVSQRVSATAQQDRAEMRSVRDEGREDGTARVEVAPAPATTWRVRGRCVEAAGATPVSGCDVQLWSAAAEPVVVRTAGDGTFSAELPLLPGPAIQLRFEADGYARRSLERRLALRETDVDLGDVPLTRGARVAGVLQDAHGLPLAGLSLQLSVRDAEEQGASETVRTDAAGGFATRGYFPPGALTAGLSVWEYRVQAIDPSTLPRGGAPVRIVAVPRESKITGTVVDRRGRPVADTLLAAMAARDDRHEESVGEGRTDANGAFTVWARSDGDTRPVSLGFMPNSAVGHRRAEGSFRWGDRNVRIIVDVLPTTTVHVVDAATGAPIPIVHFDVHGDDAGFSGFSIGSHMPDGRFRLHLPRGTHDIVVDASGRQHLPFHLQVTVADADLELEAALRRGAPRRVRILDQHGDPWARTELLLEQLTSPDEPPLDLHRVRTDENGEAELVLPTVPDHGVQLSFRGARLPLDVAPADPAVPVVLIVPRR